MSADLQLKSFIDRVLRLKEEQDTLAADIREVYAEAKGTGYDKTAMGALVAELRKREKSPEKFDEAGAVLDLYRDAYSRASGTNIATHTHEKSHSSEASSQAKTKAETESPPSASANPAGDVATPASPATNLPDRAIPGDAGGHRSEPSIPDAGAKNDGLPPVVDRAGDEPGDINRDGKQAATISEADVPLFLLKDHKPAEPKLNPDCQKPETCRWAHSQASCSSCAQDAAMARRGRAA